MAQAQVTYNTIVIAGLILSQGVWTLAYRLSASADARYDFVRQVVLSPAQGSSLLSLLTTFAQADSGMV